MRHISQIGIKARRRILNAVPHLEPAGHHLARPLPKQLLRRGNVVGDVVFLELRIVELARHHRQKPYLSRRQIAPGDAERGTIRIGGPSSSIEAPFGPDLLFAASDVADFVLHVEICEDMFVPIPPSAEAALAGATVLANLSGSPITIGRAEDRCLLAR